MRTKILLAFSVICVMASAVPAAWASPPDPAVFAEQAKNSGDETALVSLVSQASAGFFADGKFDDFLSLLSSVKRKDALWQAVRDYFTALARYRQLAFLEKSQRWEEYFNRGAEYRSQIEQSLGRCLKVTSSKDQVNLYARLLSLRLNFDQSGPAAEKVANFLDAARKYAAVSKESAPLKDAADALMQYNEKRPARELYRLYLEKTTTGGTTDEALSSLAQGFLREGNMELAESAYEIYLKRLQSYPGEKSVPVLLELAGLFVYKDKEAHDAYFAEKLFAQAEQAGGPGAFDDAASYSRAFNLEQMGDFEAAGQRYAKLVASFPESTRVQKALLRSALIDAYALRDMESARRQLEKLAGLQPVNAEVLSAQYQLGLLKQWEKDNASAKQYYSAVLEKAGTDFPETAAMAKARIAEIDEGKEMDFALKSFLDVSLAPGQPGDMSKAQIEAGAVQLKKGGEQSYNALATPGESGCTQVVLSYFWSGDLGSTPPAGDKQSFTTDYSQPGTKIVNLLVNSATGVLDRAFRIVEVE